jgi:hypothetical protein
VAAWRRTGPRAGRRLERRVKRATYALKDSLEAAEPDAATADLSPSRLPPNRA